MSKRWIVLPLLWTCACAGLPHPQPSAAAGGQEQSERLSGRQLFQIAEVLRTSNDHVRAAQYYTLAQKQGVPASEVLPRLLAIYAADSQFRLAIEQAEDYLQRHPQDRKVRRCLTGFYLAVGDNWGAQRSFEWLLRQTPDDADAHFGLAAVLREVGTQRARAQEHYRAYLALAPQGRHAEEARAGLLQELP